MSLAVTTHDESRIAHLTSAPSVCAALRDIEYLAVAARTSGEAEASVGNRPLDYASVRGNLESIRGVIEGLLDFPTRRPERIVVKASRPVVEAIKSFADEDPMSRVGADDADRSAVAISAGWQAPDERGSF